MRKFLSIVMFVVLTFGAFAAPFAMPTVAHADDVDLVTEIGGTVENVGTFAGTLHLVGFTGENNQLTANATVAGQILDEAGNVVQEITGETINVNLAANVAVVQSCEELSVVLGPTAVNLAGTVVNLNSVELNIGSEDDGFLGGVLNGFLGNLLCDLTGLLQNGGSPLDIANLLNEILNELA